MVNNKHNVNSNGIIHHNRKYIRKILNIWSMFFLLKNYNNNPYSWTVIHKQILLDMKI